VDINHKNISMKWKLELYLDLKQLAFAFREHTLMAVYNEELVVQETFVSIV
jgi:hypothetical protein